MSAVVFMEGLIYCFLVLLACVVGIADGPVAMVFFYEKEVQERVVELGLTTPERIKRNAGRFYKFAVLPCLALVLFTVFGINGARGFREGFLQLLALLMTEGIFDRLFIDGYWVNHTSAWVIPGTEDLRPYIYGKTLAVKWLTTLIGYPLLAALAAGIMAVVLR